MFQDKNENKNNPDTVISDFPIQTMRQDLEEIKNPSASKKSELDFSDSSGSTKKTYVSENLTPVQKSSPFLKPSPEINNIPASSHAPAPTQGEKQEATFTQPRKEQPLTIKASEEDRSKSSHRKTFILIIAVLVILVLAGGGYYYWTTKQQPQQTAQTPQEPAPQPAQEPVQEPTPQPTPAPSFSTDKPNYLNIDTAAVDSAALKDTLKTSIEKVSASNITSPIEFSITDTQNNPVAFSKFTSLLGTKLSPAVMSNLADTFSLFIYNDQGNIRLGLAIDSKNDALLKTAVANEEKSLVADLSPLFLDTTFTNPTVPFAKSTYNGADIRYVNIASAQPLSIDYTVFNKRLMIGTTKMTLRSILDYENTNNKTIAPINTVVPKSNSSTSASNQTVDSASTTTDNTNSTVPANNDKTANQ